MTTEPRVAVELKERNKTMPRVVERVVEARMAAVVRQILSRRTAHDHSASYKELREIVPERIKLTKADRKKSKTRPNEQLWWQTIRNIGSHERDGFERLPGGILRLANGVEAEPAKAKAKAKPKAVKAKAKPKAKAKAKPKVKPKAKRPVMRAPAEQAQPAVQAQHTES